MQFALNAFRYILLPLGALYAIGALLRRRWFEGAGKRQSSPVFCIGIGNLTVGGTGKTPMSLFLASHLPGKKAILSRGYGRSSSGFLEVTTETPATECGDEPLEMKCAQPHLPVAVCENRFAGIEQLLKNHGDLQTVILDDAFQHLPLRANKYVLLSDYQRPFYRDFPMPAGLLREFRCEAKHAHAIVITKCPPDLTAAEAETIKNELKKYPGAVFFAHYAMSEPQNANAEVLTEGDSCIAVSALAGNEAFKNRLMQRYEVIRHFAYRDHHRFTATEIEDWKRALENSEAKGIVTTRKDFMRMKELPEMLKNKVFVVNTEPKFLFQQEDDFIRVLNC